MALSGRIGLLGGGNMGSALINGLLAAKSARADQLVVAENDPHRAQQLSVSLGLSVVEALADMGKVDLLIIAVKPLDVSAALKSAADCLNKQGLAITLAAGVKIATVAGCLPDGTPIIRAMPNTPALVLQGATAIAAGPHATVDHIALAKEVFQAVGEVAVVKETLMNAVTGLSGSGPAYVFQFIEGLADAGVAQGLDRATALSLATQTVLGAAQLLKESGQHPGVLTDQVASPGGTTIAGLHVLEAKGFKGLLMDAIAAATKRGQELGGD
jgi:pyrroline-5-carboxylate reductase